MTKMKNIILALALSFGCVGIAGAYDQGTQWTVTYMTGTALTIGGGQSLKLRKIILSSGTTASTGGYLQAFSSAPSPSTGESAFLMPGPLFASTAAVTPPIIFNTTNTVTGTGTSLNNAWSVGECDECYLRIPSGGGLHLRKSDTSSGGAFNATIIHGN